MPPQLETKQQGLCSLMPINMNLFPKFKRRYTPSHLLYLTEKLVCIIEGMSKLCAFSGIYSLSETFAVTCFNEAVHEGDL